MEFTTPRCPHCGTTTTIIAPEEKILRWKAGEFIQNVFPSVEADVRELMMTGIHPECWNAMFPED